MERQRRTGRFRLEHWQKIRLILIVYDLIAVNLAYGLALWLRFDCRFSSIPKEYLTLWERFIPIYSIFNGMIDRTPEWNVDDGCLYIEGILEEKLPHFA